MADRRTAGLWPSWNKARMAAFIDHLSVSSNVAESEWVAKMMPGSAYRQRRKDAAFDRAWRDALRDGYARLEMTMLEGALASVAKGGDKAGRPVRVSERTAMALLAAHRAAAAVAGPGEASESAKAALARKLSAMNRRLGGEG